MTEAWTAPAPDIRDPPETGLSATGDTSRWPPLKRSVYRWSDGEDCGVRVTRQHKRSAVVAGDIAAKFLGAVLAQPKVKTLLSTDHFSVDGTLIEASASMKSVKPKDGSGEPPTGGGRNAEADFHGESRSNQTHATTTDP
jgi:hypothetical protein